MEPSIEALAREYRVITASLPGEPGVGTSFDADADFDLFVRHLDEVLDASGVASAVICGVSFGGLIALRYAARRGHRVRGLILVSTPGPALEDESDPGAICEVADSREPAVRDRRRSARVAGDVGAVFASAFEAVGLRETAWRVVRAPAVPRRMSRRARLAECAGFRSRLHVRHRPRR